MGRPQGLYRGFVKEATHFSFPGTEPRLLDRPSLSLLTIPTILSRLDVFLSFNSSYGVLYTCLNLTRLFHVRTSFWILSLSLLPKLSHLQPYLPRITTHFSFLLVGESQRDSSYLAFHTTNFSFNIS